VGESTKGHRAILSDISKVQSLFAWENANFFSCQSIKDHNYSNPRLAA